MFLLQSDGQRLYLLGKLDLACTHLLHLVAEEGLRGIDQLGVFLVTERATKKLEHPAMCVELLNEMRNVAKKRLPSEAVAPYCQASLGARAHVRIQAFDSRARAISLALCFLVHWCVVAWRGEAAPRWFGVGVGSGMLACVMCCVV